MDLNTYNKMLQITGACMAHVKWFLCFGNLLHLIRNKSVENDHDMDIGVFYEQFDAALAVRQFAKFGYHEIKRIISDLTKKAFYLSFESAGLPPIDIFAWYKHGNIRYHTYDVNFEKKAIPGTYVFKGIEEEHLPDPILPRMKDRRMIMTQFGLISKPLLKLPVPIPAHYGTCLDRWYPNWLVQRQGQSMSPFVVEMKSCAEWVNENHVQQELGKSRFRYEQLLSTL